MKMELAVNRKETENKVSFVLFKNLAKSDSSKPGFCRGYLIEGQILKSFSLQALKGSTGVLNDRPSLV